MWGPLYTLVAPCVFRPTFRIFLVNHHTIRYDTIRYDTIRYYMIHTIRYDTIRHDMIRYDTIRYGMIRYDTIRYDVIRYDTIRYDTRARYAKMLDYRVRRIRCILVPPPHRAPLTKMIETRPQLNLPMCSQWRTTTRSFIVSNAPKTYRNGQRSLTSRTSTAWVRQNSSDGTCTVTTTLYAISVSTCSASAAAIVA